MSEGVLEAAEEVVGGLARDGLAVALAGVAQDDAKDVGLLALAVGADEGRTGAEVDLGLVTRVALDTSEGEIVSLLEAVDEPADGVVAAGVAAVRDEIPIDPLGGGSLVGLGCDQLAPRLTAADAAGAAWRREWVGASGRDGQTGSVVALRGADGRNGWFWCVVGVVGADGRNGWFWVGLSESQVACDSLAVDAQFFGDAALGQAPPVQCTDDLTDSHLEQICHG
jgi:hypothetical protein